MPKLTVSLPDGADAVHDLTEDLITVGRIEDNLIAIVDPSVSSRHAQLAKDDGDYVLRDLGSTNGTRVNGAKPPKVRISSSATRYRHLWQGDRALQLGDPRGVTPHADGGKRGRGAGGRQRPACRLRQRLAVPDEEEKDAIRWALR